MVKPAGVQRTNAGILLQVNRLRTDPCQPQGRAANRNCGKCPCPWARTVRTADHGWAASALRMAFSAARTAAREMGPLFSRHQRI